MIKNDKEVIVLKNYVIKVNQIRWIKFSKFFKRIKIRLMNNELIVAKFDSYTEYSTLNCGANGAKSAYCL